MVTSLFSFVLFIPLPSILPTHLQTNRWLWVFLHPDEDTERHEATLPDLGIKVATCAHIDQPFDDSKNWYVRAGKFRGARRRDSVLLYVAGAQQPEYALVHLLFSCEPPGTGGEEFELAFVQYYFPISERSGLKRYKLCNPQGQTLFAVVELAALLQLVHFIPDARYEDCFFLNEVLLEWFEAKHDVALDADLDDSESSSGWGSTGSDESEEDI